MNSTNKLVVASLSLLFSMKKASAAAPVLYGLIQTSNFNELITYDLAQDPFSAGGYQANSLAPLNFTNLLPQNSITSIAVSGTTLYRLVTTSGFNELLTYDLTQDPFTAGGYQASTLAPLNFTNLLPQNSIISIAVSAPDDVTPSAVPEPATWVMMVVGFWILGISIRRRTDTRVTLSAMT